MNQIDNKIQGQTAVFFLSGSPFQALCMVEAIQAFRIQHYKVLLCLSESELPRKPQLIAFLKSYHIPYEVESVNYRITKLDRMKAIFPRYHKYKLAFVGDCNNELLIFKAFQFISDGGKIIYLDDGIATIQFFNGLCQLNKKLKYYYKIICTLRYIDFDKYFYTIYRGLSDGKHLCIENSFTHLAQLQQKKEEQKNIVFLGTCTNDYCHAEQIKPEIFMSKLKDILFDLRRKYPNEQIVYVPHGRDTYLEPEQICKEIGVIYQPTSISVELFLLGEPYKPVAIYGFTSSALYNLHLLFSDAKVFNITFTGNSPLNNRIDISSHYFSKHGILRIEHKLY